MSKDAIRPSTLDGINRLARQLKNELGIKYHQARDQAARQAGFENIRHAENALRFKPPGYPLLLTGYWRTGKGGLSGRETLVIRLSRPWEELVTPAQLKNNRTLRHFRPEGPDHLVRDYVGRTQLETREAICTAARTMQFADATKLRPSAGYQRAIGRLSDANSLPGMDHSSAWYDPVSKRYLLVDEPYDAAVEKKVEERERWAQTHGFVITKPSWAGMHAPDLGSRLYLVSHETKGLPQSPVAAALAKLPKPVLANPWSGESAPISPYFVSPGAAAKQASRKDPPPMVRDSTKGQRNSVGYARTFVGPQRRPNGRMPVDAHAEVGGLLKSVLIATDRRKGVCNRINKVRDELDEWCQREYGPQELPSERFFDLYYHNDAPSSARSISEAERAVHIASLAKVKKVLAEHYPDCPPLRSMLSRLDAATTSLERWAN